MTIIVIIIAIVLALIVIGKVIERRCSPLNAPAASFLSSSEMKKLAVVSIVRKGAEYFNSLGDIDDISHDFTGSQFGTKIEDYANLIVEDNLSDSQLKELLLIFAPTCAWDDFGGDSELGQKIYDEVKSYYSDRNPFVSSKP